LALNVVTPPGANLTNWTIRMKHTDKSSFASAYLESGDWTIVYQSASEPAGSSGWRTFTLTTQFAYDGTSNLMVDFSTKDMPYVSDGQCAAWQSGVYRSVHRGQDGSMNPLTWSGTSWAKRNYNIPNIRLTVCGSGGPPSAPVGLTYSDKTPTSITWAWTPTSSNEDEFRGHNPYETLEWTALAGSTSFEEGGLYPNTQYTRHVHAYNSLGLSGPSNSLSTYTLSVPPEVFCNLTAGCPSYAVNTSFLFTNGPGFGQGGVDHYHYVWNREPIEHEFDGSEAAWTSGVLQLVGNVTGSWYLHVESHNAEHDPSGTARLGPFVISVAPGYAPGDLDHDCAVDAADLDAFEACGSGPGVAQVLPGCVEALLDGDNDVDADDFALFQRCWSGEGRWANLACAD
jgi:hypothetical protein